MEKEKYFIILQQIKKWYEKNYHEGITPYAIFPHSFNIMSFMTPIERNVWDYLRGSGMLFYPQYPVGKYFIDFARPQDKIGIEVDGKEWHTDKKKDTLRQKELEKIGYKIYRISGGETFYQPFRDQPAEEWLQDQDDWYKAPVYKFLMDIRKTYNSPIYVSIH